MKKKGFTIKFEVPEGVDAKKMMELSIAKINSILQESEHSGFDLVEACIVDEDSTTTHIGEIKE